MMFCHSTMANPPHAGISVAFWQKCYLTVFSVCAPGLKYLPSAALSVFKFCKWLCDKTHSVYSLLTHWFNICFSACLVSSYTMQPHTRCTFSNVLASNPVCKSAVLQMWVCLHLHACWLLSCECIGFHCCIHSGLTCCFESEPCKAAACKYCIEINYSLRYRHCNFCNQTD